MIGCVAVYPTPRLGVYLKSDSDAGWNSIMAGHGKWLVMTCQLAVLDWFYVVLMSHYDKYCKFTSVDYRQCCGMLPTLRYQSCIVKGAGWKFCLQNSRCWVEIISIQHQPVIPRIENPVIRPLQIRGSATHLFLYFLQYWLTSKYYNPIHQFLAAMSNSSFWAPSHIGCWEELHPSSMSEGWWLDGNLVKSRLPITYFSVAQL